MSAKPNRLRLLAVASGGGHWVELRRLTPAFADCDICWASTDPTIRASLEGERFYWVPDANRWNPVQAAWSMIGVLLLILRVRPQMIISTGAAPGYLAIWMGSRLGIRTLWIDSIANAEELSLSGKKAAKCADLTLTQWEELGKPLPSPEQRERGAVYYAGSIL